MARARPTDDLAAVSDPEEARTRAEALLSTLAQRGPRAPWSTVARQANLFAELGLAERGLEICRRARTAGARGRDFDLAEATFAVSVDPAGASARLREVAATDPLLASMLVTNSVLRGELALAADVARRWRYFVDRPGAIGRAYAIWALLLLERYDEAEDVVRPKAGRGRAAAAKIAALREQAMVASYRAGYAEEERCLEEALAIAAREDAVAARFLEVSLVTLRARAGDEDGAARAAAAWDREADVGGAIGPYRDLARMDIALLRGTHASAERFAERALVFAERTRSRLLGCHLAFCLTLAASPRRFERALAAFRADTHRFQVPYYMTRLRVIDGLASQGLATLRDVRLYERSRRGVELLPLARLWTPRLSAASAVVYWNRALGTVHLGGRGPFHLGEHPTLRRMLEHLLEEGGRPKTLDEIHAAVWGGRYDPLAHETKCHVTLHRLRAWLAERGASAHLLETRDGKVGVADDASLVVVDLGARDPVEAPDRLADRVLACLAAEPGIAPARLEARLGVGRVALLSAIGALRARGRVVRTGSGARTRYLVA